MDDKTQLPFCSQVKKPTKEILPTKKPHGRFENGTVEVPDDITDEDIRALRTTD
jgi:hypothetical protein